MSNTKYACAVSFLAGISTASIVYYLYEKYNNKYIKTNKKCSKRRKRAHRLAESVKYAAIVSPEKIEDGSLEPNMIDVLQADLLNVKPATDELNTNNKTIKDDIFNAILLMADTKQEEESI